MAHHFISTRRKKERYKKNSHLEYKVTGAHMLMTAILLSLSLSLFLSLSFTIKHIEHGSAMQAYT